MTATHFVTGATGTVGQHVVTELLARDADVRAGLRNPDTASGDVPERAEVVAFDFAKPETWGPALADVDGLFLLRPPGVDTDTVGEFAEAAARTGVEHVVYLSALGAEKNPLIPHHRLESRIVALPCAYTLLRASFFMQNLLEVHRTDIVEHNQLFLPAGRGQTSFVDARDVGEIAAIVLTESGHRNLAYDVTGPEALDYEAVAAIFRDVLGMPITYPNPSLLAFVQRLRRRETPLAFILLMCTIYTVARLGLAGRCSEDARRVLGRQPRDMRTFVEDYATAFRNEDPTAPDVPP